MKGLKLAVIVLWSAFIMSCDSGDIRPTEGEAIESPYGCSYGSCPNLYWIVINNSLWKGYGEAKFPSDTELHLELSIRVSGRVDNTLKIDIDKLPIFATQFYEFNEQTEGIVITFQDFEKKCVYGTEFTSSTKYKGILQIVEIDQINKRISGRLKLDMSATDCPSLNLVHGIFDIYYSE